MKNNKIEKTSSFMKNNKIIYTLFVLLSLTVQKVYAEIRLPAVFTDHMVLQRNSKVNFWGWGAPSETISIVPEWLEGDTIRTQVGNMGKWSVTIPSGKAGGPYKIEIIGSSKVVLSDIMLGEVWLCSGQSNMEWCANYGIKNGDEEIKNANCPNLRIFHLPQMAASYPQDNCLAKWVKCTPETMRGTSATAYFFARHIQEELNVPVGIIVSAWGGSLAELWTPREAVMSDPLLANYSYEPTVWWPNEAGSLYNSMIHPVMPYSIAGCIWYQGEANCSRANTYARLMRRLISSWRTGFNKDFPFYLVQIAPFQYHSKDNGPALLREQQAMLPTMMSNVRMVTVSDLVDDVQDIHPRNKRGIGRRLSNLVLDDYYHRYTGSYESPVFKSAYCKGSNIYISFNGIKNGLEIHGQNIEGMIISGKDAKWRDASANVEGDRLIVSTKGIEAPYSIHYCFNDDGKGNLFSTEKIPVAPFRVENITNDKENQTLEGNDIKETFDLSPKFVTKNANPLIDFHYMADPTAVVYNGRLYVYGTNDHQQYEVEGRSGKNTYQHIHSLVMVSTDDMVNWTYHGTVNVKSQAPWSMASWAPSIVSRKETDGKTHFYLYYSNSGAGIGMLTSTSPVGPWTDPLGKALIDSNTPGLGKCQAPFDPGVVIDETGCGWLSFGGGDSEDYIPGNARIVRLSEDMKSLDSEIVEIKAPYHFEANELNYMNGTWIYTYNTNWKERTIWPYNNIGKPSQCCMSYMTSRTPLDTDSWTYRDNYFKNPCDYGMSGSNNHTHLVKFQGKYYLLYHNLGLQDSRGIKGGFRSVCVDEIEVDEKNLTFKMGTATAAGVTQTKPLNPFVLQQAETTAATQGVIFKASGQPGNMVAIGNKSGQAIEVRGANFTYSPKAIKMKVKGKGTVNVYAGSPSGRLLTSVSFDTDNWKVISESIKNKVKGKQNLYFIFDNGNFLFDEWQFVK